MGEQRGKVPLLTVDLASVTVELNLRESGARFPCKWSSVLEIYISAVALLFLLLMLSEEEAASLLKEFRRRVDELEHKEAA